MKKLPTLVLLIFTLDAVSQHQSHESWGPESSTKKPAKWLPMSEQRSVKMTSSLGSFVSHQVNLSASGENIVNDAANEPSIAVNPNNPQQIAIGWRQFNNIFSSFRQAGVSYSNDGGETWVNSGPLEPGVFRSDPVLSSDANGQFFYQSLKVVDLGGVNESFDVDQWRSIDGGQTWIDKTAVFGGDKSWFAIDQSSGLTQGNFYAAWNVAGNQYFPNTFNYSVDNGMSFSQPEQLSNKPVFGTVAVGFDGEVYVAGGDGDVDQVSDIYLLRSNNPTSQMFPDFQQVTAVDLGGPISIGDVNPVGLLGQVWVAADKSDRHTRGNIYFFSSVDPAGDDRLDVNFARSTNGGLGFQPYVRINQDDDVINRQWLGTMAVAPNGRIDLIWLDTRDFPLGISLPAQSRLFYSYSYDGGITFSANQPISQAFNHFVGYPVQRKMGDYIDMVADNQGAHIAYTATFTGGQDVYYLYAKPAAFEENPYFPSHEMDGLWQNPEIPRQGIVSKTLVTDVDSGTLVNFEAVFTETPDGTPTWFILDTAHPVQGDEMTFVVMYPTGDLSEGGVAVRPIGLATKSRLYDGDGELLKNQLNYQFNMSESVVNDVIALLDDEIFDLDFYRQSPFYGVEKTITLSPLVPGEQPRTLYCNAANLVAENPEEKAEGRVPMVYQEGERNVLFMADFTYQKTTDEKGQQSVVLVDGLAVPSWEVTVTATGDLLNDASTVNQVYKANGGNGFFKPTTTDPGVTLLGTETYTATGPYQHTRVADYGVTESFNALAFNGFCGPQ